jgi:hypothetical protein
MSNGAFEPGHTYTPVIAPDGEVAYLDSIDTPTLTGGVATTQLSSDAVNNDFTSNDQGPTKVCNKPPKIPNLGKLIPKPDRSKRKAPHKLSASQTGPPPNNQPLLPGTGTPDNSPAPPSMPPKQGMVQQNDLAPQQPRTPLEKLNAFFDPIGPQLKAGSDFVDMYAPHYDPTKPGEGVRVIRDSYISLGGGKLFGWLIGKFGPELGPLLPRIIRNPPNVNPEEEWVWVRTNSKGVQVIYREFEEAFYKQGNGVLMKLSDALKNGAVEKLEQYYKIRGIPYPLAPK